MCWRVAQAAHHRQARPASTATKVVSSASCFSQSSSVLARASAKVVPNASGASRNARRRTERNRDTSCDFSCSYRIIGLCVPMFNRRPGDQEVTSIQMASRRHGRRVERTPKASRRKTQTKKHKTAGKSNRLVFFRPCFPVRPAASRPAGSTHRHRVDRNRTHRV